MPRLEKITILLACLGTLSQLSAVSASKQSNQYFATAQKLKSQSEDRQALAALYQAIESDPTNGEALVLAAELESPGVLAWREASINHCTDAIKLNPSDYRAYYWRAVSRLHLSDPGSTSDYRQALQLAQKRLTVSANDTDAIKYRALAKVALDQKKAGSETESWVRQSPNDGAAWYFRGYCLDANGEEGKALEAYARASKLLQGKEILDCYELRILGNVFYRMKKLQEGLNWFSDYGNKHKSPIAAYWCGNFAQYTDQPKDALKFYQKAVDLQPEFMHHKRNLADSMVNDNRFRDAIKLFDDVLKVDPQDVYALERKAYCLDKLAKRDLAEKAVREASQRLPSNYKVFALLSQYERDSERAAIATARAIELLNQGIAKDPLNAKNYQLRAQLEKNNSNPQKALADLDLAVKLDPADPTIWHDRAVLKFSTLKQQEAGLADETKAIEVNKRYKETFYLGVRAGYYSTMKRFDEALADASKCIVIQPDHTSYKRRAQVYTDMGNLEKAMADLTKALQLKRTSEGFHSLGNIYYRQGKLKKALTAFDTSLAIDPRNVTALCLRAHVYIAMERFAEALEDCNRAIKIAPKTIEAYDKRARAHAGLAQFDLAAQDMTDMIKARGILEPWLLNDRARFLTHSGKYEQAARDLDDAYQLAPSNKEHLLNAAKLYYKAGKKQEAIERFNTYLSLFPQDVMALRARARCYLETEQYKNCVNDYTTLLSRDATNPTFYERRALAYQKLGEKERANEDTRKGQRYRKQAGSNKTTN